MFFLISVTLMKELMKLLMQVMFCSSMSDTEKLYLLFDVFIFFEL